MDTENIVVRVKSRLRVPPAPHPPLRLSSRHLWEAHHTDTIFEHIAVDLTLVGTILGIEFDPTPSGISAVNIVRELTNAHLRIVAGSDTWLDVPVREALGEHTWPRFRVARGTRLDITINPPRVAFDTWGYEGAVTFTLALTGAVGLERLS